MRIATRASALARWQAAHVGGLLQRAHPGLDVELVLTDTVGDQRLDVPIWQMGGKGVFAKEVQALVLHGRADVAVHSAKDLPSVEHPGLAVGAVPERGDPRDALVGARLADLPPGAVVGTGSVRRRAQLADLRPDLTFTGLRGNIQTRLAKAAGVDAIVVAAVALERLDLAEHVAEVLAPDQLTPQVAQGALAVECRADDDATRSLLATVDHGPSRRRVEAERAYLAALGGGCDLPAGAHAVLHGEEVVLDALLCSLDGRIVLRSRQRGTVPEDVGAAAAEHLLRGAGGAAVLEMA